MKTTAKSAIEEMKAFIDINDYNDIEMKEEYEIDKNIYELTIYQGAIDIIEGYIDYLYDNLEPVLNSKCCSVIKQSHSTLKVIYPIYISESNTPQDFITLNLTKVNEKQEVSEVKRLYMYHDKKTKMVSTSLDEIIDFSVSQVI